MVLSTSNSSGIHAFSVAKAYYCNPSQGSSPTINVNPNYDSTSFTTLGDANSRFQKELVSRLSQEVRTATTTGRVQELRQAVSSGAYQPDAAEIAKRLLFFAEG